MTTAWTGGSTQTCKTISGNNWDDFASSCWRKCIELDPLWRKRADDTTRIGDKRSLEQDDGPSERHRAPSMKVSIATVRDNIATGKSNATARLRPIASPWPLVLALNGTRALWTSSHHPLP